MLRAHVGYDDLRGGAKDESDAATSIRSSTSNGARDNNDSTSSGVARSKLTQHLIAAGQTYPSPGANQTSRASPEKGTELTQRLLPSTTRTPQEALAAAALQPPIEYEDRTIHSCQQAALNAELRTKVEAHAASWSSRLAALREVLTQLPAESALQSNREGESVQKYLGAYRCTETLPPIPDDALVPAQDALRTPTAEVASMTHLPTVPADAMRRALDDMLRSPYLLAPLQTYVAKLSVLDKLSGLDWSGEGPELAEDATASTSAATGGAGAMVVASQHTASPEQARAGGVMTKAGAHVEKSVLCPSRAAVALHERLHYNPGDYAERELKKSEEALLELQRRVQAVKQEKEDAIDANDPITALRSLHAQVDFSNDLLLLYKARMAQMRQHTDDVQDFRQEVVALIDDARRAAQAVRTYAQKALPNVQHDITATANAMASSEETLAEARAIEKITAAEVHAQLAVMDGEARGLWQEMLQLLERIQAKAQERTRYVQQALSRREQRAKATAQAEARLKAQTSHREQLRLCEEVLARWEEIGGVYSKYVEACVPRLLKHLSAVEDAHEDLAEREAEGYVAFYEQFVYAAEEARAKRRTQADRMKLLQRSAQLNTERADDTLDPDAATHAANLAHATRELDEVQLYLRYIDAMEAERRAEVDPVLHHVLVRHAQAQAQAQAGGDTETIASTAAPPQLMDKEESAEAEETTRTAVDEAADAFAARDAAAAGATRAADTTKPAASGSNVSSVSTALAPADAAAEAAVATTAGKAAGPATMAHPFVAARHVGLAHEENYLQKQEALTERELRELEGKLTGLRHSREELRAMESKYQNADAIRELLGLN